MALRTLEDAGKVGPGMAICGVGAGTAPVTFALAERGCLVFAADRFLELNSRSNLAPATMLVRPRSFTGRTIDRGAVIPIHSDPRGLNLPSEYFDGVFAGTGITHLGSPGGLAAAIEEISRVLKPGGVASVTADFLLEGPNGAVGFDEEHILLTPDLIEKYIVSPSGMELVDPPTYTLSRATYDGRAVLKTFASTVSGGKSVERKRNDVPNLVLFHQGFLFCPVHLTLKKPTATATATAAAPAPYSSRFGEDVERRELETAGVLTRQMLAWRDAFGRDDDEVGRKNAEITRLTRENVALTAGDEQRRDLQKIMDDGLTGAAGEALTQALTRLGYSGFGWSEVGYWPGNRISSVIGTAEGSAMSSRGQKGVLCFGPYIDLARGRYRVVLDVHYTGRPSGKLAFAVVYDFGAQVVAEKIVEVKSLAKVSDSEPGVELQFDLDAPITNAELRVISESSSKLVVRGLKLFERRLERRKGAPGRS